MSPELAIFDLLATYRGRDQVVLGVAGPQGSGKSTLAASIARAVPRSVTLSLDDLYHTRAERQHLATHVHPLLATRGVPGTHDVALGVATLAALRRGESVRLPRFDKSTDDRVPASTWPIAARDCPLVILESWCLGAPPENAAALAQPINRLEANEDTEGTWRRWVNDRLTSDYPALWSMVDRLVWLEPPALRRCWAGASSRKRRCVTLAPRDRR